MQGYSATPAATAHPGGLPEPGPEAVEHSLRVRSLVREAIAQGGGAIPFSRYMDLVLYAPGLGYYAAGLRKFGAGGDFVTAPEFSPLFSHCLARQCAEVLDALGGGDILEAGGGTGALALELLAELERLGRLPRRYRILELSPDLRARQRRRFESDAPHLLARIQWLDSLPGDGLRGVVVANEVLDAMPVHRVHLAPAGEAGEWLVGWDGEGFAWRLGEPAEAAVAAALAQLAPGRQEAGDGGYDTEVGLAQPAWVRAVADVLEAGAVLILDYGYPRREYYHAQRREGTLRCHYRHRAHADPLILPGLQDITAHVEFTALAEAAVAAGLQVAGFTNQAQFLIGNGLTEELAARGYSPTPEYYELVNQVKRLTLPGEMGEAVKVLALSRDLNVQLSGFYAHDIRYRL